jgi:hypothetical protein
VWQLISFAAMIIVIIDYFIDKSFKREISKFCALALFPVVRVFTFRGHSRLVGVQNL